LIYFHLRNFNSPEIQKHICRILVMPIIYATDSWLSFRFYRYGVYIDLIRTSYEAFVIYTFVTLLIEYLGGESGSIAKIKTKKVPLKLPLPFCMLKYDSKNTAALFLRRVKQGALQYVLIRPTTAVIGVALELAGEYCPGNISPRYGYFYITVILFIAVTVAMYALVAFYQNTKEFLLPYKPIMKFLAVKFVIFFSFWQSIAVSGLAKLGAVHSTTYWTSDNVGSGIQDTLTCCEMVLASILHIYCFSYSEYVVEGTKTDILPSLKHMVNPWDVAVETHKHLVPTQFKKKHSGVEVHLPKIHLKKTPKQKSEDKDLEKGIDTKDDQEKEEKIDTKKDQEKESDSEKDNSQE